MASVRSVGAPGTAWEPCAEESRAMYLIRERFFRYAVDVAAGQDDLLILASVLALDLAEDEERTRD